MKINIINLKPGEKEGLYRVEADGVCVAPSASFAVLPEVIDLIYSGREEELAVKLEQEARLLVAHAEELRAMSDRAAAQAESIYSIIRGIWEAGRDE